MDSWILLLVGGLRVLHVSLDREKAASTPICEPTQLQPGGSSALREGADLDLSAPKLGTFTDARALALGVEDVPQLALVLAGICPVSGRAGGV
jgi:hypothetical protein